MTVNVPALPEAKKVCWEFATDGYDIGFGVYFDWGPVTGRSITVHVSESSDDEDDDEELEGRSAAGSSRPSDAAAVALTLWFVWCVCCSAGQQRGRGEGIQSTSQIKPG